MSDFTAEVFQNEYLPVDGTEVNAIVTVTASGQASGSAPPPGAEIVIVDTSGSMGVPRAKLAAAREATSVAIDAIRDGVAFALIGGTDRARLLYPRAGGMAIASAETRAAAVQQAMGLTASGGTAIGSWLTLARELFQTVPDRVAHAILLTDGENEHETPEQLDGALAVCEGAYQCDCRGVGADWEVSELRRIASTLLGTVDIIPEPAGMIADFQAMMQRAMQRATGSVSLRLWTPIGAEVAFVRQVSPTVEELTERASGSGERTRDYPTGAWGAESRDYHLCIKVPRRAVGEQMLAGRVTVIEGDSALSDGSRLLAIWTDEEQLSTQMNQEVAHYTGQAELADSIRDGLEARRRGDEAAATSNLGRAVQLASESGNDGTMKLLGAVVEIEDAASGTVRLRRDVAEVDEMTLDTRSTKTVRVAR